LGTRLRRLSSPSEPTFLVSAPNKELNFVLMAFSTFQNGASLKIVEKKALER